MTERDSTPSEPRRIGRDIWNFTPCTRVPSEAEIMARWQGDLEQPVVSIICNTYNHRNFIEDAVAGFLIQETSFPFEILIHDDASTDGTQDVIKALHADYPNLIKPLYQSENQYSQGKKPWMFQEPRAKGKYIAFCEGDDFWTDPTKLEKQVEVLEKNPAVVIAGHDAMVIDETGALVRERKFNSLRTTDTPIDMLNSRIGISTLSVCYRNMHLEFIPERARVLNGDTFLFSILSQDGSYYHSSNIISGVYRLHGGGVWSLKSKIQKLKERKNTSFWMMVYYKRIGNQLRAQKAESGYLYSTWMLGEVGGPVGRIASHLDRILRCVYGEFVRLARRI